MPSEDTFPWFAVKVKPRWEKRVSQSLRLKDCAALLPVYIRESQWSDRIKPVELPLFPGYLFARLDPHRPLVVLGTPGVQYIVSFGKTALPIDQSEIDAIQKLMSSELRREPSEYPQNGDLVRVTAGPLRGVEGVVQSGGGDDRLILSITLLQRAVAVEVKPEWIEFVDRPATSRGSDYPAALAQPLERIGAANL